MIRAEPSALPAEDAQQGGGFGMFGKLYLWCSIPNLPFSQSKSPGENGDIQPSARLESYRDVVAVGESFG